MQKDLYELIEIESVCSTPAINAPFGINVRRALDWFLNKANSMGFTTGEYEGYCGYLDYNPNVSQDEIVGILCHLDVVPAGEGWVTPPYQLNEIDGYLYGRGVVDNKGPLIAVIHALKDIKDNNIQLKRNVRIIVGCNEENGSSCIKHYITKGKIPKYSFVPDADFPIINSEKGILHLKLTLPKDDFLNLNLSMLKSGVRPNVVPDSATCTIKKNSPFYEFINNSFGENLSDMFRSFPFINNIVSDGYDLKDFTITKVDEGFKIDSIGTAGHAMNPEIADNAIWKLFCLFDSIKEVCTSPDKDKVYATINKVYDKLCTFLSSSKLGIANEDDKSGDLTINIGQIDLNEDNLTLILDIRLPITSNYKTVTEKILCSMPPKSEIEILHYAPNLYIDESSPLIKTLLNVYTKCTGEDGHVIKTGGGTYARELPNAIAYGPTFPDTITNIHNADEKMSVENFYRLKDIYYEAIIALSNIE